MRIDNCCALAKLPNRWRGFLRSRTLFKNDCDRNGSFYGSPANVGTNRFCCPLTSWCLRSLRGWSPFSSRSRCCQSCWTDFIAGRYIAHSWCFLPPLSLSLFVLLFWCWSNNRVVSYFFESLSLQDTRKIFITVSPLLTSSMRCIVWAIHLFIYSSKLSGTRRSRFINFFRTL